jgi:hypothetical protein
MWKMREIKLIEVVILVHPKSIYGLTAAACWPLPVIMYANSGCGGISLFLRLFPLILTVLLSLFRNRRRRRRRRQALNNFAVSWLDRYWTLNSFWPQDGKGFGYHRP